MMAHPIRINLAVIRMHTTVASSSCRQRARRIASIMAAVLLTACAAPTVVETKLAQVPARTVLVLTGAGMVPYSNDDPRYESMWLQTATTYAQAMQKHIDSSGRRAQLHVKNERGANSADYAAQLLAGARQDAVLQVTITHVKSSAENTIYLSAEFFPLEYRRLSNGQNRAIPQKG